MTNLSIAVQTIKDTISAQDVGVAIGLEIRHGRCKCPIHNGGDFNCVLYKGNRGFYCHTCKAGGDVVSLVQKYYSMSFKDCIAWFNDTFRMGLDIDGNISPRKRKEAELALKTRKNAIEFRQWKERFEFDLALTAEDIVKKLEEQRDANRPRRYGEEWNDKFCEAVLLLPEARQFAEDCMMYCVKDKDGEANG